MMEWAKSIEALIGAVVASLGLAGLAVRWIWGHVARRVETGVSGLRSGHESISRRLEAVEAGQIAVDQEIKRVDAQLRSLEQTVGKLASATDVQKLAVTLAEVRATGNATAEMVDSLHKGLLALATRGDK